MSPQIPLGRHLTLISVRILQCHPNTPNCFASHPLGQTPGSLSTFLCHMWEALRKHTLFSSEGLFSYFCCFYASLLGWVSNAVTFMPCEFSSWVGQSFSSLSDPPCSWELLGASPRWRERACIGNAWTWSVIVSLSVLSLFLL